MSGSFFRGVQSNLFISRGLTIFAHTLNSIHEHTVLSVRCSSACSTLEATYGCDCTGCLCGGGDGGGGGGDDDDDVCDDTNGGATDPDGDDCDDYVTYPYWCGGYDDSDFTSNEMCCACGGGAEEKRPSPAPMPGPSAPTPSPTGCENTEYGGELRYFSATKMLLVVHTHSHTYIRLLHHLRPCEWKRPTRTLMTAATMRPIQAGAANTTTRISTANRCVASAAAERYFRPVECVVVSATPP